jgi:Zn finger protein HypA/HybF involved in hydrogenase expression
MMPSYLDPISMENVPRIEKVCKRCGEESIFIPDLIAYWSVQEQQWKIGADVDTMIEREEAEIWCHKCGERTDLVDVVLDGEDKIFRG